MNFQAVRNANGQNVDLVAKVVELNGEGVSQKSGKPYKKITLLDNTGEKHLVTIRGNNIPTAVIIQQEHLFSLSSYQGNANGQPYTGYSGFWNPPQNAQQAAPRTPESTNSPKADDNACECRQCAAECAAKILSNRTYDVAMSALTDIIDVSIPLSEWFLTGKLPKLFTSDPNQSGYGVPDDSPEDW